MTAKKKPTTKRRTSLPTGISSNELTKDKWKKFINLIANGTRRDMAVKEIEVSNMTVQSYLITEPDAVNQYREAQISWVRREWPYELIEQVMLSLAMGITAKAACEQRGLDVQKFYTLVLRDPSIKEMYDEAREIRIESMADDIIDISDETSKDKTGNRINHEVVHRSKLKVETRKWLMSVLNPKRYGNRIQQDVNQTVNVNHVELLDNARKRRELAHKKKRKEMDPKEKHNEQARKYRAGVKAKEEAEGTVH